MEHIEVEAELKRCFFIFFIFYFFYATIPQVKISNAISIRTPNFDKTNLYTGYNILSEQI